MAIQTLTGPSFYMGSATSNAQSDTVQIDGVGNTIYEGFGNLAVTEDGVTPDSGTAIRIGGSGVVDTMTIGGNGNLLYDFAGNPLGAALVGARVTYTTLGTVGNNFVGDGGSSPLTNTGGTTTLNLGGGGNQVFLNGNATNTVRLGNFLGAVPVSGSGNNIVYVGAVNDDDLFGYTANVTFVGGSNIVAGGDENFTITDVTPVIVPKGNNIVVIGDGTNAVTLQGNSNEIVTGGGNNTLDTGGSNAQVYIQGADHSLAPDPVDDPGVPLVPTDVVTLRGANDIVSATYEQVTILGAAVTSAAFIQLGDANNTITLGGTGGNTVKVGNGNNQITASGNASVFNLGHGANNQMSLTGNGNLVVVTDAAGVGNLSINLNAGSGNQIFLGNAGGEVTGTSTGPTYVTQGGPNALTVNLGAGIGSITGGDGNDTVTANGDSSYIVLGKGTDTVVANGNNDYIHLQDVAGVVDHVTANGNGDQIYLGNGNDVVSATGNFDYLVLGNGNNTATLGNSSGAVFGNGNNAVTAGNGDYLIFGNGNNTVTAGTGGVLSFHATAGSVNNVNIGGGEVVYQQNGTLHVTEPGSNTGGDVFFLNNLAAGSSLTILGNGDLLAFGSDSNAAVTLNPSVTGETILVAGDNSVVPNGAVGDYSGVLTISGFGLSQTMDLQNLIGGVDHNLISSFAEVIANLTGGPSTPYDTISLQGGGSINFVNPTALAASEFIYSGPTAVPTPI